MSVTTLKSENIQLKKNIRALKSENAKLQNKIAKLEAEKVTLRNRVNSLKKEKGINNSEPLSNFEIARRLAFILNRGGFEFIDGKVVQVSDSRD